MAPTEPTPPVRFTRTTDGVSIAYMVWPGEGVPFLRIASPGGIPMALAAPMEDARQVARDRPMVRFDWRGTGQSTRQVPASMDDLLHDIDAVVSAIDSDVVDVLALNSACIPACSYVVWREGPCRSLTLADPMLRIGESPQGVLMRPGWETDFEGFLATMAHRFFPGLSSQEIERVVRSWAETVPVEAQRAFGAILQRLDLSGTLAGLDLPVLILKVLPRSAAASVAALIPNSILVERRSSIPNRHLREAWDEHIGSQFADQPHTSAAAPVLTQREQEILGLLAGGCSNDEIGRKLSLSTRTIERHVQNVYAKLNVHNRAEATRWAIEHGVG